MSKTSSASAKPAVSAAPSDKIDAKLVRDLANLLSGSDLTEIEVEKGDLRIRVARQPAPLAPAVNHSAPVYAPAPAYAAPTAAAAPPPADAGHDAADILKSPMVGTAYLRPSPDAKPFIEIGAHVTAGQKLLLVEAMKTFNDIVAHKSGAITAILIEDAQPVEYGQPLLVIA
jgi:acetyl-CoA carboxylase biotin carboxyl carrier protein